MLLEYEPQLSSELIARIETSLRLLIAGTLERKLPATYTNIALMKAYMLIFAGTRFNQPAWISGGEGLAEEIYELFQETGCFEEYNSPTYYGVDLFALGMWVTYSSFPRLQELGRKMEGALWAEIGNFYHAGLMNLCGPFDRTYGIDMRKYVTPVGVTLRMVLGREKAPLPDIDVDPAGFRADHKDDLIGAIWTAAVGLRIPGQTMPLFSKFEANQNLERIISKNPRRVATAHLSENNLSIKGLIWPGVGREDRNYIFRVFPAG